MTNDAKKDNDSGKEKFVAPDGGYGWIIVLSLAVTNIFVIPIIQSFGLIFKDKFAQIGMSSTDCTIIINVNSAFGMALGLFNGPLLRKLGYRKLAILGSLAVFTGVSLTSLSNTFVHFILSYGLVTSIGNIWVLSSFSLALNTYFKKLRNRAMGFGMTLTGLGPVFIPYLLSFLLSVYGSSGTMLLMGSLSLHSLAAALLLHPVKWHLQKNEEISSDELNEQQDEENTAQRKRMRTVSANYEPYFEPFLNIEIISKSQPNISNNQFLEGTLQRKGVFYSNNILADKINPQKSENYSNVYTWEPFSMSHKSLNCGKPSYEIKTIQEEEKLKNCEESSNNKDNHELKKMLSDGSINKVLEEKPYALKRIFKVVCDFFDLNLLKDLRYVNLMLGLSLAMSAELNFSILTPFILSDLQFSTEKIAVIMSTIAFADIIFRFITPFIGEWLGWTSRVLYMTSLFLLVLSRTVIIFFLESLNTGNLPAMLSVAVCLGLSKGLRTVYMGLVIPDYVPLHRLPSASGLQQVTNGIVLMTIGPILGMVRDSYGSFSLSIGVMNFVTCVTLSLWSIELCFFKQKK